MPKRSNLAEKPVKKEKRSITEADLAETRAKIIKASDDLEAQLEIRLQEIQRWKEITSNYPIEIITGIFAFGFALGSGIIGEILRGLPQRSNAGAKGAKKRRSPVKRLLGLVAKTGALAAGTAAFAYFKIAKRRNIKNNKSKGKADQN